MRVHHQQHAVHHFHDPLNFAAEISVAWRVNDVDPIPVPLECRILRANGDSFLTLEVHRVHHAFLDLLIGPKCAGLPQQLIDQRCLAVINVRNDGDITDFIHSRRASPEQESGEYYGRLRESQTPSRAMRKFNRAGADPFVRTPG